MFAGMSLSGFCQENVEREEVEKKKPKAVYENGSAKITVWENKSHYGKAWLNFRVEKVYQKSGETKSTNSFNEKELLELKSLLEKVIVEEGIEEKKGDV